MTNIKLRKGYLHRFQTKKRRRRENKTDYTHRRNMLRPNLKNYGALKSRLVVRRTNRKIICQIVKAYADGDRVVVEATSDELRQYGLCVGLTNYSAAYATGLLVARKALVRMELGGVYGAKQVDGKIEEQEDVDDERRAYQVFLDIGLGRSTRGSRYFAAMKGASDGGLKIPHSEKVFPGYKKDEDFDAQVLRDRIYGKAVKDYMIMLRENDNEKYQRMFSEYIKNGIAPEDLEGMYEKVFENVRAVKEIVVKERKDYSANKKYRKEKMSGEEKKKRALEKVKQAVS
ncbi:60S ribosomal protein L5 [Trachipleistophora hominis]|uniref:60S ribosomal protein L5 n=1 Tax=Trachipleistophora hominis TaxID=72359 RepID=L7JZ55_TRAHO|nr:60S ribosomal protein L5 [Trachipleistophora hominis]